MLTPVTAFVLRQFPNLSETEQRERIAAMLDTYYADPQFYATVSLWRLHDAARVSERL